MKCSLERVVFIPDQHIPYNDKTYWKLLLKVIAAFTPDRLVILGDFADFYAVSSFDKDPKRTSALEEEVAAINLALDQLDRCNVSKKDFYSGNHEDRLERYLKSKAPELFGLIEVEKLLKLKERGWKYFPYKEYGKLGRLYITHDTGVAGKDAHIRSQHDFGGNVVIGHTHRIGFQVVGNARGKPHVGAMFGWGGDVSKVDYRHRIKALRDWSKGFGLGYVEPNGNVHIVPVTVVDNACVVEGKRIAA
jgi:predicted phosphodiesterase